jgi:hypothetical protein
LKKCSELLDKIKLAKLQLLQGPSEPKNEGNMDNGHVRHEVSTNFWTKRREYLKDRINDLQANKNKNIGLCRGINEFKKGY